MWIWAGIRPEGRHNRVGLLGSGDQKHEAVRRGERRERQRDPRHARCPSRLLDADDPALALVKRVLVWEQRRSVAVRPEPEQDEIEPRRSGGPQPALVLVRGLARSELPEDAMNLRGRAGIEPAEQSGPHHRVVGALVLGRHASLIGEPQGRPSPCRRVVRGLLISRLWRRPPGQHELSPGRRRPGQQLGTYRRGILEDLD